MEHRERAERPEDDVEEMEARTDEVGREIDEVAGDWERKKEDSSVPGAVGDSDEDEDEDEEDD